MQNPIPLLFTYLFGEVAQAALQGASERLLLWAAAFEAWLEELQAHNPSTVTLAQLSWRRLLGQQPKLPWELSQGDLEAHLAWLKAQGCAAYTVYRSVKAVSDFYRWCSAHAVDPQCPPSFNPAAGISSPLPPRFSGVQLLSRGEVRRLLEAFRKDESPIGQRDYAFFLARLRLGVSLPYLQKLQWGQVEVREGSANVRWREGCNPARLPDEVWEAVQRYLTASGRLAGLQPEEFVFAPLCRPTRTEVGERASDWLDGKSLTPRQLWHTLKRYGALAHIPPEKLTLEGLRLTALRLKLDEGCRLAEMRLFMDSRSPLKALKYRLKKLPELSPDAQEAPVGSLSGEVLSHTQHLYQPGDGLKHGWYARSQPPEKVKAILAEDIHGIEEALAGLYLLGQGLMERYTRASSASEMARLGDAYTLTASRLGEMHRAEKAITGGKQGSRERASQIESFVDALVRVEASQGRPTSREAVLADLQAQALGGGDELGLTAQRLEEVVASMRLVLRNTLDLAMQTGEVDVFVHLVNIYSSGCSRLVHMLRDGQVGEERLINYIREQILRAIAEISKEWDLSV